MVESPSTPPHRPWFWVVLAVALAIHAGLGIDAARRWTPTHDEYWHLPYGLYYWRTGDLSADPINPPLVRMWAALPLLFSDVQLDLDGLSQNGSPTEKDELIQKPGISEDAGLREPPQPYPMGDAFLRAAGPQYRSLFWHGRLMILVIGLTAAVLLALIARSWHGEQAGIMAAVLWACCPTLLSQSVVVTHDLALAAATVATLWAFNAWRNRPTWQRAALLGVILGIAQMTKLTAVLLYPLCIGWWCLLPRNASARPCWREAVLLVCAGVMSWVVLCAGYGFDGVGRIERHGAGPSATEAAESALPVPYRQAWQRLRGDLKSRHPIFLNGDWQEGGYPQYYAWALLYKLPLGTLALIGLGGWACCRKQASSDTRRHALATLFAAGVFVIPASLSSNQIGIRYILPAIPCLILFASQAAVWWNWRETPRRAWLTAIAFALVPCALRYHPHHLAYFNEIAGGPIGGRQHLVDSNIDWGQDLYELAEALQGVREPVSIAYFGSVPPVAVGLTGNPPPQFFPQPGRYAVSVNFVQGRPHTLRLPDGRFDIRGLDAYGYFRFFTPRKRIGYSIDVYELTPEDVARFEHARRQVAR